MVASLRTALEGQEGVKLAGSLKEYYGNYANQVNFGVQQISGAVGGITNMASGG